MIIAQKKIVRNRLR